MRFERILENGRLWAVMYEGESVNILERVRLNKVRDFLISIGVFDYNGFEDYNDENG